MSTIERPLRRARSDRGSAATALELVLITPMVLLIILVGIALGRTASGQSRVQQAAAAGARAASTQHTPAEAETAARSVIAATLHDQGIDCRSATITVDTSGMAIPPGTPAHVAVTVDCTVAWADLAIPGWPGSHTVTATAASPLDPRRETP
jgi:Flp pilus assembly protein TadG